MNKITPTATTPSPAPSDPTMDPTTQEAAWQAALDIGFLAFLARGYAGLEAELQNTTDSTKQAALRQQLQSIEDQFNKIMALFHVDAQGNVSFDYDDGSGHTQTIQIPNNDATSGVLTAIQTMEKSYTSISTFSTFAGQQTDNPLLAVYQMLAATNYNFELDTNNVTRRDAIFFMLSLNGSPVGDLSGDMDEFLGFRSGAILQQTFVLAMAICAVLANDSGVDASAIEACLSITTKDSDYQELASMIQMITADPDWKAGFQGHEDDWLWFESRFWPYSAPDSSGEHIFKTNAVPLTKLPKDEKKDAAIDVQDFQPRKNSTWHRP